MLPMRGRPRRAGSRELRVEVGEDAELGVVGMGDVEVVLVVAAPEEGLAVLDALDVVGVDVPLVEHGRARPVAEVVAYRPDRAHLGEEAGGEREMDGGASEHAVALPDRGLDGVEGDRADARSGTWGAALASVSCDDYLADEIDPAERVGGTRACSSTSIVPDPGSGEPAWSSVEVTRAGINFADTHATRNDYLAEQSCR